MKTARQMHLVSHNHHSSEASEAVLVVGGAGYIGSHTCKLLASRGILPVTFDDLSTGHEAFVRWGPLVLGNIADPEAIERTCRQYEIESVIHFAASAFVGESVRDPAKYYKNNVAGTLFLLDGLARAGVARIILSSTCAVYGSCPDSQIDENIKKNPINPYGRSKGMVEDILADYEAAYGLRWMALRYFNACGADSGGQIGERHDPEPHLIPRALMALDGQIDALDIFGVDYPTRDGTAIRDFIHVSDLAEAHWLALAALKSGKDCEAINVGSGRGHSVKEIVTGIESVTGRVVPIRWRSRREGDPASLVCNPFQAQKKLGFTAVHSDLDNIIRTAWSWHRSTQGP